MSKKELMILGDFLDSELTDKYFRISNGNTQVNATELMNLPILDDIYKELISARKHKTENKRYTRTTEKIQYTRALCN
jgi:adenine-specific DNA-methyltransferase